MPEITRRQALTQALTVAGALAAGAGAQAPASPTAAANSGLVFEHDLPQLDMHNWHVHVSYVHIPPGHAGKPHRHPGFVLAYVLEGAVVTKISGQPERTYHRGEMFYEPPGSVHQVSRNPSATDPATLLALILAPKGEPLVLPAPASPLPAPEV